MHLSSNGWLALHLLCRHGTSQSALKVHTFGSLCVLQCELQCVLQCVAVFHFTFAISTWDLAICP